MAKLQRFPPSLEQKILHHPPGSVSVQSMMSATTKTRGPLITVNILLLTIIITYLTISSSSRVST